MFLEYDFNNNWKSFFIEEVKKDYYKDLSNSVENMYNKYICYPDKNDIFRCFKLCDINDIKVVILGQDPYFNEGEADGLAFSVKNGEITKSLKNIYKCIEKNFNIKIDYTKTKLDNLAKQGVFLLNTILSVKKQEPLSFKKMGYETFTDNVIKYINTLDKEIVFLLWGNEAIKKKELLNNKKHLVLTTSHPSPLGAYRGFNDSTCFKEANDYLKKHFIKEINYEVINEN